MSSVVASQYRANALFRVLAFLDNTGTQPFILSREVDAQGCFRDPDTLFAEGTAIAAILAASLRALRANVRRFFVSAEEAAALLRVIGTGPTTLAARMWDCMTWIKSPAPSTAEKDMRDTNNAGGDDEGASMSQHAPPLPIDTEWSTMVCHPVSLTNYAEQLESEFPIHLLLRLREVLDVPAGASSTDPDTEAEAVASTSTSSTPFVEQMLIDGLDEWLRGCADEEVRRIILACGVSPAVLNTVFAASLQQRKGHEQTNKNEEDGADAAAESNPAIPDALVDFVVDVVFPPPAITATSSNGAEDAERLQDWLLLSYEKNREIIDLGEEDEGDEEGQEVPEDEFEERDGTGLHPRKIPRAERLSMTLRNGKDSSGGDVAEGLGAWQPTDGEEVLTAENLDRYLRENPRLIPKEILREKRKSIADPAITAFELENHYTAAELKKAVREEVGTMSAAEASAHMRCPVSSAQVKEAAAATRKAQFVEWVLALHRTSGSSASGEL